MTTLQFSVPPNLSSPALEALTHAYFAGGQDGMPFLSEVVVAPGKIGITRPEDESGHIALPWHIDKGGMLMTSTATLIERSSPYQLVLELARGKVNQVRNQAADWEMAGLELPAPLRTAINDSTMTLGQAIARAPSAQCDSMAQAALNQASAAADQLVKAFVDQVFQLRHQRQGRLDTTLGCRLGAAIPTASVTAALRESFNTVCLPLTWADVEATEGEFNWGPQDQMMDWAITAGIHVVGGPLIDFSREELPHWFLRRPKNLANIANLACNYAGTVIKRFRGRIRTWQLTEGGNASTVLNLSEEETLWLTLRIAETARQWDSSLELLIGLAQPWGEYLANQPRNHSPFMFADTLVRSGINLAGLNLEFVMGVSPRGSYCRDVLEACRLIDLYALLGLPLQITLGFPSQAGKHERAMPGYLADAGRWQDDFSPEIQATWAEAMTSMVLCKPAVQSVVWTHLHDAEPHMFPACGLVDSAGNLKPALQKLGQVRATHLR